MKELIDEIDLNLQIEEQLKEIIKTSSVNDWRKYFIKVPNLIEKDTEREKFIRKENDDDILLLSSSRTSGYNKEYYSRALYYILKSELNNNISIITMKTVEQIMKNILLSIKK